MREKESLENLLYNKLGNIYASSIGKRMMSAIANIENDPKLKDLLNGN